MKKRPELVPVAIDADLVEAHGELAAVLAAVQSKPDNAISELNEIFVAANAHADKFDAARTAITQPLNASKRAVDAYFMPTIKGYRSIADECRAKIERAQLVATLAEETARAQARQALLAGDQRAAAAIVTAAQATPVEVAANLSVSFEWDVDWARVDLAAVPREWLTVDATKVDAYLAGYKGASAVPPIPGLPFTRVATSRKKG